MSKRQTPALEEAFLDMPAMIAIVRQLLDEIEEQRSRKRPGSWKGVWESLCILVRYVAVDDWQTLYAIVADERKVRLSAAGD